MLLLCLASPLAASQSDEDCKRVATYREGSGESLEGIKAILEVLEYRMQVDAKSACQVLRQRGQFPWVKENTRWRYPKQHLTRYLAASKLDRQLPEGVYYFNNMPFKKIGKFCCKIGRHWFYYRKDNK